MLICTSSIAQTAPLGKELIKSFSERMSKNETIEVDFTFTLDNRRENITDTHKGKLTLKGKMYYMQMMGMEVYYDGDTRWQFIPDVNEVTISRPTSLEGGFMDNPTQLFADYEKDFNSQFLGEKNIDGKAVYEVDLYPDDISVEYSLIRLQFEKQNLNPVSIRYQGKDGTNYIFDVNTFRSNRTIDNKLFTFDPTKHRDIEVVDLR